MKKIIVTAGPALFKANLRTIHKNNYIYRVNGAHGTIEEIITQFKIIRKAISDAELILDLPGNKIRTANLDNPIVIKKGERFTLSVRQINYKSLNKHLKKGDEILAADSTLKFVVEKVDKNDIMFKSESNGTLENNKGLHIRGIHHHIPFLFEKDINLLKLTNDIKIDFVSLSFVRNNNDIRIAKECVKGQTKIIAKIETKSAVDNINKILEEVDYINVDRGDLSTEVGLVKVPSYQKYIVDRTLFFNKNVFVATQFLKNMINNPVPSISEIVDLYNTLKMGVFGIQLSDETAVGKYPVECLEIINRIVEEIESEMI